MVNQASTIQVELRGGPLNGTSLRSDSEDPDEVHDAIRCYFESGRGAVGASFTPHLIHERHPLRDELSRNEAPVYECVARELDNEQVRLICEHRPPE